MKTGAILVFIILFNLINKESFSQRQSDLGLFFTTGNDSRVFLEYRKPFKDKFHFKLGASYGNNTNNFFETGTIINATDSSVTTQRLYNSTDIGTLRIGIEKQIASSVFSWGVNALIGYRSTKQAYYNELSILVDSVWEAPTYFLDPFNNPTSSRVVYSYVSPGAQLFFAMNLPIVDKLELTAFVSATLQADIFVQQSGLIGDPSFFSQRPATIINMDTRAGIGVRYLLGKKEEE